MRSLIGWLALLGSGCAPALAAQSEASGQSRRWALGVAIGVSSFSRAAEGKDPEGTTLGFAPYRPTMWGLVLSYGRDRLRLGLTARYGQAGLSVQGRAEAAAPGALVVAPDALHLGAFGLALSTRLLRLRGGPTLRPSLAVAVERWTAAGSPTRTVAGGQAGIVLEVALTRALVGTLEGELGYTPASPFRKEDFPDGFTPSGTWRRTLLGGLYWRF